MFFNCSSFSWSVPVHRESSVKVQWNRDEGQKRSDDAKPWNTISSPCEGEIKERTWGKQKKSFPFNSTSESRMLSGHGSHFDLQMIIRCVALLGGQKKPTSFTIKEHNVSFSLSRCCGFFCWSGFWPNRETMMMIATMMLSGIRLKLQHSIECVLSRDDFCSIKGSIVLLRVWQRHGMKPPNSSPNDLIPANQEPRLGPHVYFDFFS